MNALLIDDEMHCIDVLKYELGTWCPSIKVIGVAQSGKDGIALITSLQPDIIFLDIEMPGMSGFELLSLIPNIDFDVVFVTAYDQYAIKAFKYSAADYLMKPVQGEMLKETTDRLLKRKGKQNDTIISTLKTLLESKSEDKGRLPLNVGNDIVFVKKEDIIRCKADGNYSYIYLLNNTHHYVSKSIKEISELLEGSVFLKCHQSHLINKNHIQSYSKSEGGYLVMADDAKIPISRGRRNSIMSLLF